MTYTEFQLKVSQSLKELFHEIACIKKKLFTRTSQLINDGEDGIHPFITAEDIDVLSVPEEVLMSTLPFPTNNAIPRVDAMGRLLKSSLATISDGGTIDIPSGQNFTINGVPISGNDKNFLFEQNFPGPVWTINHTLNKYPAVEIFDGLGNVIYAQVDYLSLSIVQITFKEPMVGSATLN